MLFVDSQPQAENGGGRTANGEVSGPNGLTAAHGTLPFGTKVLVTNVRNGRTVLVRINDRGPYGHSRIIDLSRAAARELDMISVGTTRVSVVRYLRGDLSRLSAKPAFCFSLLSCLDGAGCVALMGSDAGKLSFRPF
jgi:rare lipoprotein A